MKQTRKSTSSDFKRRDEKGVAIITVLSVLMLMTIMVISFFTMASNELNASRSTAEGLRAVSAKDIAINLAIAQIREATTREGTIWVSQPGAIRLYGRNNRSGRAASIYKLYSSNQMIAGSLNDIRRDLARDWHQRPEQWIDLNRPVINPDPSDPENIARASLHFPIVDPRAFKGVGQEGSIEGFSYDTRAIPGIVAGGADHAKRLPMPVQWLYILADGSVGYLDKSNRFVGQIRPSEENPITSRIAFWTDDETCKVNVNTASEGVFWDTPRCDTREERSYASSQPATGEYQRYPGHPAMTCMSTVLFPNEGREFNGRLDPRRDREKFEALWTIAPGIGTGGSKGGQEKTKEINAAPIEAVPKEYHLYTAPEEILFQSDLRGGKRLVHQQITQKKLETAKFFLTARSRAPETTLLGMPRMSMWPMSNNKRERTAFDAAIAFCATIKKKPFFFQRQSAYSRHGEFYNNSAGRNDTLYEAYKSILDDPIPGFGASFGDKYGKGKFDDRNNILAETIDYFRGTNLYDPSNKRWQYTKGGNSAKNVDRAVGHGQIAAICLCGGTSDHRERWFNSRLPLPKGFGRMIGLSEFAIFLVLRAETKQPNEAGEVAYIGDKDDLEDYPSRENDGPLWPNPQDPLSLVPGKKLIQLGILVEGFAPAHGWTSLQPQNGISVGGGTGNRDTDLPESFTLGALGKTYRLERSTRDRKFKYAVKTANKRPKDWVSWGGYGGVRMFEDIITFEPIAIDAGASTIDFGGSTSRDPVRIILYDTEFNYTNSSPDLNNLIQSYQLAFPKATFPVPNWYSDPDDASTSDWYSFTDRMRKARDKGVIPYLFSPSHDVLHSLVPSHGDYRLISSKRVIEPKSFVPHPNYGKSQKMAHALTDYRSSTKNGVELLPGGEYSEKFMDMDYPDGVAPDFPIGPSHEDWAADVNSRIASRRHPFDPQTTGDFDNGVGNAPDGPYINRPDDGDLRGVPSEDPYFDNNRELRDRAASSFSPNRVIPSPGMLGSLSTGVQSNVPWQTLLFRPMDKKDHFGAKESPPDHLWMDYFWMPIVQPYVISEPFSTAGKVNMNFQILPFQYIRRATGLHAVMKAEKMLVIPNNAIRNYKDEAGNKDWRKFIDIGETLKQWDEKFEEGETFRSATEICDMYLVPQGERWRTRRAMQTFWEKHKLTGDNTKERPYTNIYPRLTVRSNTFKVHIVAQSITKVKGTEPDTFDNRRDKIAGEYRGSAIIERSIAPDDEDIPDYGREKSRGNDPESLDVHYTYRVVNEKRFAP